MKIYVIYDTRKNEFFSTGKKKVWSTKGAAKNALIYHVVPYARDELHKAFFKKELAKEWLKKRDSNKYEHLAFKDQTRYVCVEYTLDIFDGSTI